MIDMDEFPYVIESYLPLNVIMSSLNS